MQADAFRNCSNTDRTCADQLQLHRRQEFYDGLIDMVVEHRLLQCVDVDYIEIVPSTMEVRGAIQAECDQTHCPDTDILLRKQFKLLTTKLVPD